MSSTISAERAYRATAIPWTKYIPHAPHAHQHAFLTLECREALYGGAAGGGKSDALLMAALQYVDRPGYAALLLRKTYKDLSLPGALMNRAESWLAPTDAHWTGDTKTWKFPSGATVSFGHLQHSSDKFQYQGAEFDFIAFDEASQFVEDDYTYLFTRLRRLEGSSIPVRMRCASNPGGIGHAWVKRRFVEPASRGGRIFIPARLADNPSLDQDSYRQSLEEVDPVLRAQLLGGDWDVRPLSGREYFSVAHMEGFEKFAVEPKRRGFLTGRPMRGGGQIAFHDNASGNLAIYDAPKAGRRYLIGADVAGGISEEVQQARTDQEGDACGAYVCDAHTGVIVAELHLWTDADSFSADLARLGYLYGPRGSRLQGAEIAVEDNNKGLLTLMALRDIWRYGNIFHRETLLTPGSSEIVRKIGWHTGTDTRPPMLAQLAAVLRDAPQSLRSLALLAQMRTFVWNKEGTKALADTGAHDDLVMACAITQMVFLLHAAPPVPTQRPKTKSSVHPIVGRAPKTRGRS